jgi:hypothetical protein
MGHTTEHQVSPGLILTKAHPDDAYIIGNYLRDEDTQELNLVCPTDGSTTGDQLRESIESSDECWAILDNTRSLLGFWGHGAWPLDSADSRQGYVWLVSTDVLFTRYPKEMTRLARDTFFPQLDRIYSSYGNAVLHTNDVHLRWLASLDFELKGVCLVRGEEFYKLMRTQNV